MSGTVQSEFRLGQRIGWCPECAAAGIAPDELGRVLRRVWDVAVQLDGESDGLFPGDLVSRRAALWLKTHGLARQDPGCAMRWQIMASVRRVARCLAEHQQKCGGIRR